MKVLITHLFSGFQWEFRVIGNMPIHLETKILEIKFRILKKKNLEDQVYLYQRTPSNTQNGFLNIKAQYVSNLIVWRSLLPKNLREVLKKWVRSIKLIQNSETHIRFWIIEVSTHFPTKFFSKTTSVSTHSSFSFSRKWQFVTYKYLKQVAILWFSIKLPKVRSWLCVCIFHLHMHNFANLLVPKITYSHT